MTVEQWKPAGVDILWQQKLLVYDNMDNLTHKKKIALCIVIAMCARKKTGKKNIWVVAKVRKFGKSCHNTTGTEMWIREGLLKLHEDGPKHIL